MNKITRLNWFKKVFGGAMALCVLPMRRNDVSEIVASDTNLASQRYIEGVWKPKNGLQCEWIGGAGKLALQITRDGENVAMIGIGSLRRFNAEYITMSFNIGQCVGEHPWPKEYLELMRDYVSTRPDFALINWPNGTWSVERITHENMYNPFLTDEEIDYLTRIYVNGQHLS